MTREDATTKAARYLSSGRVVIRYAGPGHVDATVRGDGVIWPVTYGRGGWHCPCPARGRCSHALAVGLCTAPDPANPARRTP